MPLPVTYTETTLAEYMHSALGDTAVALGWTAPDSYDEAVNETMLAYGTTDLSQVAGSANLRRLRAYARVEAWRQAMQYTAADFAFSADGASYSRDQIHEHAKAQLALAEADLLRMGFRIATDRLRYVHDPYTPAPTDGANTVP